MSEHYDHRAVLEWKRVGKQVFNDFFHGSWAVNLWSTLAFTLIAPLISSFMNSPKGVVLSVGVGLTMLLWIIVIAVYRRIDEPQEGGATLPAKPLPPNVSVTSVNQSGGITAHTVVVGPKPITLSPSQRQDLVANLQSLSKDMVLLISNQDSNNERLKRDVQAAMLEAGLIARDFGILMDGAVYEFGIVVCFKSEKHRPQAIELLEAFQAAGLPCKLRFGPAERDIVTLKFNANPDS